MKIKRTKHLRPPKKGRVLINQDRTKKVGSYLIKTPQKSALAL